MAKENPMVLYPHSLNSYGLFSMVLKVHGKHKQACKKVACHFLELGKGGNGSLRDYAKYQQQMLYYLGTEGTNYVHRRSVKKI